MKKTSSERIDTNHNKVKEGNDIMTAKQCPKCGGLKFSASAHVVQTWKLDCIGKYDKTIEDCTDVTHRPDNDDLWHCQECGYEAPGKQFDKKIDFVAAKSIIEIEEFLRKTFRKENANDT